MLGAGLFGLLASLPARAQSGPPGPPVDPVLEEGKRLYVEGCSSCHGANAEGSTLTGRAVAPSLIGVGAASVDFYLSSGRMPLADINVPQAVRKQPAYNDVERAALVAYVTSLGPGGPPIPEVDLTHASLSRGGELYQLNCGACHNASGVGGALSYGAFAPSLHPPTPTEIAEAIRIGPGNMPVFGPDTFNDEELNDIVRYVVYLQHPEDPGGAGLGHFGPIPEGFVSWLFGLGPLVAFVAWVGTRA